MKKLVYPLLTTIVTLLFISACVNKTENSNESPSSSAIPAQTPAQAQILLEAYKKEKDQSIAKSAMESKPAMASHRAEKRMAYAHRQSGPVADLIAPYTDMERENYQNYVQNSVKLVSENPVSTFSIDVDTAAYSNMRRLLNQGVLPQSDAIRVEELLNYFTYDYRQSSSKPSDSEDPFNIITELGPSPWHPQKNLLHVGLQAHNISAEQLPNSNLVFLIDVSGSMRSAGKLELLIPALKMLSRQLGEKDRISIAVYAGAAGVVLEPTPGNEASKIYAALEKLEGGGSTNGGAGIRLAYSLARDGFIKDGINRVILATDGDFNVGTTDQNSLKQLIEHERESGVSLSVLGFGRGNYNDALMQQLAQVGNGNAAYIDNINEARKVLVDELSSTLHTVASDVKIQIEFNPALVSEYRLIGYETRQLNREDFNNDKVDAGDVGAGHSVTALYELTLAGASGGAMDDLRYADKAEPSLKIAYQQSEIAFVKLRYKPEFGSGSILKTLIVDRSDMQSSISASSDNYRFSAAVAALGQILKGGRYTNDFSLNDTLLLAQNAVGQDKFGYRAEFVNLVRTAEALTLPRISNR